MTGYDNPPTRTEVEQNVWEMQNTPGEDCVYQILVSYNTRKKSHTGMRPVVSNNCRPSAECFVTGRTAIHSVTQPLKFDGLQNHIIF